MRLLLTVIILSLALFGCAEKQSREKIAVRINDYTLTTSEFNEIYIDSGVFDNTPEGREAFLKNLITRKVLLSEAQAEGMDRKKESLKAIENFWEQIMLNIMIDTKTKEISANIVVTEGEIRDRYDKTLGGQADQPQNYEQIRDVIKWQIIREKERTAMDAWVESLKNKAKVEVDRKAVGLK